MLQPSKISTYGNTQDSATQVLGCARVYAHSTSREPALRRQHFLRRNTFWRPHLHFRLRHWLSRSGPPTGKRMRRAPVLSSHLRFTLPLGPHSRHPVLPPFV